MKQCTRFLMALAVSLLPLVAQAAPVPPLEGLEALRRGFADLRDFTADSSQEKHLTLLKRKMTSQGVVRFRKPDLFFMELYPPHASRLMLRDNVLTLSYPEEKGPQQLTLPPEEGLQRWFALLARPVTQLPEGVDIQAERQGESYTLTVAPRDSGPVKTFTLTFQADGRFKRLVIEERNNDRTVITFSRLRRNTGLTDRDFRLE